MYNQESYKAIVKLISVSNKKSVITFPYDVDFFTFCCFVNYLYYPKGLPYKGKILAWATLKKNDFERNNISIDGKVLLFIPDTDKDYDVVYLTTSTNSCFKYPFATEGELEPIDDMLEIYQEPNIDINEIIHKASQMID